MPPLALTFRAISCRRCAATSRGAARGFAIGRPLGTRFGRFDRVRPGGVRFDRCGGLGRLGGRFLDDRSRIGCLAPRRTTLFRGRLGSGFGRGFDRGGLGRDRGFGRSLGIRLATTRTLRLGRVGGRLGLDLRRLDRFGRHDRRGIAGLDRHRLGGRRFGRFDLGAGARATTGALGRRGRLRHRCGDGLGFGFGRRFDRGLYHRIVLDGQVGNGAGAIGGIERAFTAPSAAPSATAALALAAPVALLGLGRGVVRRIGVAVAVVGGVVLAIVGVLRPAGFSLAGFRLVLTVFVAVATPTTATAAAALAATFAVIVAARRTRGFPGRLFLDVVLDLVLDIVIGVVLVVDHDQRLDLRRMRGRGPDASTAMRAPSISASGTISTVTPYRSSTSAISARFLLRT